MSADDFLGTVAVLPRGVWTVRTDGTSISGQIDVGELLSAVPVVILVRRTA